jgi:hypothetical protein
MQGLRFLHEDLSLIHRDVKSKSYFECHRRESCTEVLFAC